MIVAAHPKLCQAAQQGSAESLAEPHGLELLSGTAIQTRG